MTALPADVQAGPFFSLPVLMFVGIIEKRVFYGEAEEMDVKEYLSRAGSGRVTQLDTAFIEAYGQEEGDQHIARLTELFNRSEERLVYGRRDTPYLRRQEELVDYLNQSLQLSLLASSFYDRVFFRRVILLILAVGTGSSLVFLHCRTPILLLRAWICRGMQFSVAMELSALVKPQGHWSAWSAMLF